MIKNYRKTKILATIGPSSEKITKIEKLILSGVDAFRINCSHTNNQELKNYVQNIRKVEKKLKRPIGILIDLQGPKLRIGKIENNQLDLKKGQKVFLINDNKSSKINEIPLPEEKVFRSIKVNHPIFIDDGKIKLKALKVSKNFIETKVILEGTLSSKKGINLPETILKNSSLTELDKKNVRIAMKLGIDWIALSFIQSPDDIKDLRKICKKNVSIWQRSKGQQL